MKKTALVPDLDANSGNAFWQHLLPCAVSDAGLGVQCNALIALPLQSRVIALIENHLSSTTGKRDRRLARCRAQSRVFTKTFLPSGPWCCSD